MRILNTRKQGGFTLIEMIVSLAIFTVVAVVAIGALLRVMDANRKSINLKTAINNMNFVLESMSREMRVGSKYSCESNDVGAVNQNYPIKNCSGETDGTWTLVFTSSRRDPSNSCNLIFAYRLSNGVLQKGEQTTCGNPINDGSNSVFYTLSDPNVNITSSRIEVNNDDQPYAKFFIKGDVGIKNKEKTEFTVQTMVSQRIK